MAGEGASLLLSRATVPVLFYMTARRQAQRALASKPDAAVAGKEQ
jgi:hypothetical protein